MSNGNGRGIVIINKAHCLRRLVVDVLPGKCGISGNQCMMCYDQRFSRVREIHENNGDIVRHFSLDTVREQLSNRNLEINRQLEKDRVVRVGALGDITYGDRENYEQYRLLFQMINAYGYKYILCTKSSHSVDSSLLEDMNRHKAILQVSMSMYSNKGASHFERVDIIPPGGRRRLIEDALEIGVDTVLRLCPIHPRYMDEHVRVMQWYAGIGGTRVILETLRIMRNWIPRMPEVDFSMYVTESQGGCYTNYLTPPRDMQEEIFKSMISIAKINGIDKGTICGDMESMDKYGSQIGDCCHASDILHIPVPARTWENSNVG